MNICEALQLGAGTVGTFQLLDPLLQPPGGSLTSHPVSLVLSQSGKSACFHLVFSSEGFRKLLALRHFIKLHFAVHHYF